MIAGAFQRAVHRTARRRSAAVERCGMCASAIGPEHRHVLDQRDGAVLCACAPCSLLFGPDAAGGERYRLVPAERRRLAEVPVDDLNVPVGLAFFVKQGDMRVVAHYPSPLGTTESGTDPDAWRVVEARVPALAGLKPRVEALLVWESPRQGGGERWIVPIDDCYRLVALIRRNWTGAAGGGAVWREVAGFFAELGGRRAGSGAGRGGDG